MASIHSEPFGQGLEKHIVDADPSGGGGVAAPIGSKAEMDDGTATYRKTGGGDTDWTRTDAGKHDVAVAASTDNLVDAVVAVADAPGGATVALCTVDIKDLSGSALSKVCVLLLHASDTQYHLKDPNANITLDTFTKGSVLASSAADGWWLIKTDSSGQFSCNANNVNDQIVWFVCDTSGAGGVDSAASGVLVRGSVPDSAEWSA